MNLPLDGVAGLDPRWSRRVTVKAGVVGDGVERTWHVLDNGVTDPVGTLLCVHGNPTWSYIWRRVLAEAPPGWRVVAPDQLGMGFSQRLSSPRTLSQRVDDLSSLTAALGITGPVVTLAHDWGGAVSLGWAVAHASQVTGIVLSNTAIALPAGTSGPSLIRLADTPGLRELACVRTTGFIHATLATSRPALSREVREALLRPYGSADLRRAIGDFVADIPFAPGHPTRPVVDDIARRLSSLDVPALLLWGPRDPVFGEAYLDDLRRRLPRADVHRFAQASHLVMEDEPSYAATVWRWVTRPRVALASPGRERPQLWAALDDRADDDAPAVVEVGGRSVSWRVFHRRVAEVAAGLIAHGVAPGDRVGLLVPPSADLALAVYAVWRAGAVIVVADKGLGVRGMGRALRSARVDHLIGTAEGLAAAKAMRLHPPGLRIGAAAPYRLLGAALSLADLARAGRDHLGVLPEPSADDECAVVFTSGATGPAKGVVYRHRQLRAQVALIRATYGLTESDRIVAAFAPFALYGPALGIGSAVPDMDVTAPGSLTAVKLAEAVAAVDATVVFASPAALRNVLATQDELTAEHRKALWKVRLLMSAGAPVPVALLQSLGGILPAAHKHTPYGMTEVLPVTDISEQQINEAGAGDGVCVGRPLPGVTVRVVPLSPLGVADGEMTAAPSIVGEICVRAEHVKDRYDALWVTEQAASRDAGWHRTGDVGHFDDQSRLWVEGRLVHVITTSRGVVTPVEVENRAEALASVRQAAAVGVGPAGAQMLVLIVVPDEPQRGPLADVPMATALRDVAGIDAAAFLVRDELPVDIRHQSKIDRQALAVWATDVLAGGRP
ncbi:alpha/beta fold hydrolase [Acidothermaceae bacterium B102]|nr:alpha/beta fold hydrolase [Acidothermaceae bacterium B102]